MTAQKIRHFLRCRGRCSSFDAALFSSRHFLSAVVKWQNISVRNFAMSLSIRCSYMLSFYYKRVPRMVAGIVGKAIENEIHAEKYIENDFINK